MEEDGNDKLIGCLLIWATFPVIMVIDALVLKMLWGWFVIPLGIRGIGIFEAAGLVLLVGLLTHQHRWNDSDLTEKANNVLVGIVLPLEVLAIGYIIKLLMG